MQLVLSQHGKARVLREYPYKTGGFSAQDTNDKKKFDKALNDPANEILEYDIVHDVAAKKLQAAKEQEEQFILESCKESILDIAKKDTKTERDKLEVKINQLKATIGKL